MPACQYRCQIGCPALPRLLCVGGEGPVAAVAAATVGVVPGGTIRHQHINLPAKQLRIVHSL